MFAILAFGGSHFLMLLVIGLLLFGRRLAACLPAKSRVRRTSRACLRFDELEQRKPPARPQPSHPLPPWLLAALTWLWREFYFWTIDDWE